MVNSLKIISIAQTNTIFITNPNNPTVKTLIGRVINFKIGLMKKLINPRISPANNRVFQGPANSTPAIK